MRVLFLDDNQFRRRAARRTWREDDLVVVKTAEEAIAQLRSGRFDYVSLDHDLGGEVFVNSDREDCGMEVVRFMERMLPCVGRVNVHSWNVVAAKRMVAALEGAGYDVERRLFGDSGFA